MTKLRNMKLQTGQFITHSDPDTFVPDYFTLSVLRNKNYTEITMQFLTKDVTTSHMFHVTKLLKRYLPTILQASCFNEENLPFCEEVTHTELGHLFEHILLEYLCKEKINAGSNEAIFRGVTKWDWNKDQVGTFHIKVDVRGNEKDLLYFALEQSILLLKRILHYHRQLLPYPLLVNSKDLPISFAEKQMV